MSIDGVEYFVQHQVELETCGICLEAPSNRMARIRGCQHTTLFHDACISLVT